MDTLIRIEREYKARGVKEYLVEDLLEVSELILGEFPSERIWDDVLHLDENRWNEDSFHCVLYKMMSWLELNMDLDED